MVPQLPLPQLLPYLRIRLEEFPAGDALQVLHDICDGQLRRRRYETVDVVHFPGFKQVDGKALFPCNLLREVFQELLDLGGDDLLPILHTPNHMVVNVTYTSPVSDNICFHTLSIS